MRAFAALLDRLAFSPRRNDKLRLLQNYFRQTPDPDRGYALAALTGGLNFTHAQLQQYDLKGDDNTSAYAGAAGCFHYIWGL